MYTYIYIYMRSGTNYFNSLFSRNPVVKIYCSLYSCLSGPESTYDSQELSFCP